MNERPGRKALFTGALPGAPASDPSKEIAAHVRQLNDEIADALSSAVAGKPAGSLESSKFGVEYSSLIDAVNGTLDYIRQVLVLPVTSPAPAVITSGQVRDYEQTIADLRHQLEQATSAAEATDAETAGISSDQARVYENTIADLSHRLEQATAAARATHMAAVSAEQVQQYRKTIADLEHRFELMVEKNPVPMLLTTPAFQITEANDAYAAMSGIKSGDLTNTSLTKFHVISQKGEGAKVALHEKRRSFGEVTVELPSGIHVLEQFCIPVIGGDGTITSLMFVYNDITAQKKKNEEIEQLRYRSETIVKENPIPMLMTNAGFVIIEANPAFAAMSGITLDRVIGMSVREIKILEQKGEGAKVAIRDRKRAFGEVTVELPSGKHILEQYVVPILDASKEIASLLFVYNDVSEQRREHLELVKKMDEAATLKQRSDIIVRQNPMPIMLMDTSFRILMVNEAYTSLTGLAKERLVGMNARDFRILEQTGEGLKKVLTEKKRSFGEIKIEFPTGIRILDQYGIPMTDAQGNLSTILTVYNDVTAQREQEKKIKQMMDEATANAELLSQSAAELQSALAKIAAGDLTYHVSIDEADPLVRLKMDYNTAVDSIHKVLSELLTAVKRLDATVNDTIRSTEEIARATEQVAVSGQKATDNAKAQLSSVEKIASEMSDVSASIEEIASTTHDVLSHADKASKEGIEAAEIGRIATSKMQNVEQISKQSVDEIIALNEQMRQISKIVNLITDIASQTNLLALNAAIEAARAGEHGRGFAVVAGEVKNLAGESKKASGQIENLIKAIQSKSDQTATSMKKSFEEIQSGIDSVNKTVDSLNRIVSEARIVSNGVNEITKATEDQARATTQLMSVVESVTQLTRDNQQRMEDMAALAEETSASTEEIASASAELAAMAEHSRKMVEEFRLN
jgi:methyl-accepting chemotaxis protein